MDTLKAAGRKDKTASETLTAAFHGAAVAVPMMAALNDALSSERDEQMLETLHSLALAAGSDEAQDLAAAMLDLLVLRSGVSGSAPERLGVALGAAAMLETQARPSASSLLCC